MSDPSRKWVGGGTLRRCGRAPVWTSQGGPAVPFAKAWPGNAAQLGTTALNTPHNTAY
jgi:hypothetical protein